VAASFLIGEIKMAPSWRDTLPIHPAAEILPRMSPDELRALGEDIKRTDLRCPIVLWTDGKSPAVLLDGINRLDAIEMVFGGPVIIDAPSLTAGEGFLACNSVIILDRSADPWAFVISANIQRRHLTTKKKRELIAKLLRANPSKSDREIGRMINVDNKTVASVRAGEEAREEIPHVESRSDSKGRQQPAKRKLAKPSTKPSTKPAAKPNTKPSAKPAADSKAGTDVGPSSTGEIARKDAEIEELRNAKRMLEIKIAGLEREIKELKAQLLNIPDFLDRTKKTTHPAC
jgi:hypothetical protein